MHVDTFRIGLEVSQEDWDRIFGKKEASDAKRDGNGSTERSQEEGIKQGTDGGLCLWNDEEARMDSVNPEINPQTCGGDIEKERQVAR